MPAVIGLDIGNSAFRAVEVSVKSKTNPPQYILERALVCDKCVDLDSKKMTENLKHFVKDAGFSTKNVVMALPESHVFSTILNIPLQTEKEVKNYLEIEGSKIFPRPLSELVYSFVILGPNETNKTEVDVNVVASGKEFVSGLFDTAKNAGLTVLGIESEAYAIVRALSRSQILAPNDALLVVNVGSVDVDMMVLRNGYVRFSRNVGLGGTTFNKAIAQALDVTEDQAEEYKKSYGLDNVAMEGKIVTAMKPVAETLISEIKRTMNFYSSRNSYCEFKKVLFSGGSAVMPGLLAYSAENLGMEVELANPFASIEFSPRVASRRDELLNLGPVYTVAMGLALKEIV